MHAGYPIMGLLDIVPEHLNASGLRRFGTWDLIHKISCNHDGWRWSNGRATAETFCNFFSLYVNQNVNIN
jgi:hypothetical protein